MQVDSIHPRLTFNASARDIKEMSDRMPRLDGKYYRNMAKKLENIRKEMFKHNIKEFSLNLNEAKNDIPESLKNIKILSGITLEKFDEQSQLKSTILKDFAKYEFPEPSQIHLTPKKSLLGMLCRIFS